VHYTGGSWRLHSPVDLVEFQVSRSSWHQRSTKPTITPSSRRRRKETWFCVLGVAAQAGERGAREGRGVDVSRRPPQPPHRRNGGVCRVQARVPAHHPDLSRRSVTHPNDGPACTFGKVSPLGKASCHALAEALRRNVRIESLTIERCRLRRETCQRMRRHCRQHNQHVRVLTELGRRCRPTLPQRGIATAAAQHPCRTEGAGHWSHGMGIGGRVRGAQRLSDLQVPRGGEEGRRRRRADGAAHNLLRTNVGLEGLTLRSKIPPSRVPILRDLVRTYHFSLQRLVLPDAPEHEQLINNRIVESNARVRRDWVRLQTAVAPRIVQHKVLPETTSRIGRFPNLLFPIPSGAGQRCHPVGPPRAGASLRRASCRPAKATTGKEAPNPAAAVRALLTPLARIIPTPHHRPRPIRWWFKLDPSPKEAAPRHVSLLSPTLRLRSAVNALYKVQLPSEIRLLLFRFVVLY
jgi:hypothetical protein